MATDYNQLAEQLEKIAADPPAALLEDEATRKRILAAVQKATPEIESSKDTIQRIMYTPLEVTAVRIGCEIKLFEKLAQRSQPMTSEQLAHGVEGDPTTLDRIFKYLGALGWIKEVGVQTWAASRLTHTASTPAFAAGVFHALDNCGPATLALPQWLADRKYKSSWDVNDTAWSKSHDGLGAFAWLAAHPVNMQNLGLWMSIQRYGEEFWLDAFPFKDVVTRNDTDPSRPLFVDVGGGIGHQCQALLSKFPELKGRVILEDQPEALKGALPVDGMETKDVDFFVDQPVKGAKAYYLRNILHDWPDDRCLTILSHIKAAMSPDSLLLLDEMVVPSRNAHKIATQVDVTMMGNLASEERSEERWHALLNQAGFKIDKIFTYQAELGDSVIVASAA